MSDDQQINEFLGKWKLDSSENFDELMKVYNVSLVTRKMAGTAQPVLTITKHDGGELEFVSSTTFKTTQFKCKLGEEFEEQTGDGATVKSMMELKGNTLHQTQQAVDKRPESVITRAVSGDTITMVIKAGDVTCTRVYKKM